MLRTQVLQRRQVAVTVLEVHTRFEHLGPHTLDFCLNLVAFVFPGPRPGNKPVKFPEGFFSFQEKKAQLVRTSSAVSLKFDPKNKLAVLHGTPLDPMPRDPMGPHPMDPMGPPRDPMGPQRIVLFSTCLNIQEGQRHASSFDGQSQLRHFTRYLVNSKYLGATRGIFVVAF